ncbi:MAG: hypothetical protein HY077_15805 [Elusimicrobia bacterium]|nr:hypothetical protein [Elusimicrobiota bacterium]
MSAGNLIGSLVFSTIGLYVFNYGRKESKVETMALGGALMVYPYFTPTAALTWLIGAALTAYAYYARE